MGFVNQLMGAPSKKDQARASIAKQPEVRAKAAGDVKESEATVLDIETSEVNTAGTDVAVVRQKKIARKGVPGLGL